MASLLARVSLLKISTGLTEADAVLAMDKGARRAAPSPMRSRLGSSKSSHEVGQTDYPQKRPM
jgi:hypothetical protein